MKNKNVVELVETYPHTRAVYLIHSVLAFFSAGSVFLVTLITDCDETTSYIFILLAFVFLAIGVLLLLIRNFLIYRWVRICAIVFSIINLLQIPIGTILHGFALREMLNSQSEKSDEWL